MKIAIIPARGGSKRIPKKNIKLFCGKPIIGYAITTAISSGLFDKVVVSTDCFEIAEIAKQFGAEVPFMRDPALADDFAPTREVVQDALNFFEQTQSIDYICCIYPTTPFINPEQLINSFNMLNQSNKKNACFSATEFHYSPYRGFTQTENGLELLFPQHVSNRSQDLQKAYHDAGQFYWYKTINDKEIKKVIDSSDALIHILPHYLVHDIDTQDDWVRAELYYKAMKQN
ncbi:MULTISPECIES: pseudaminic acid cytidylyltransferase [Pseudoalteromonas]|uniref:pseudaminic acid cytidylyltransferase n=1 Tax=Pseudoalteromonas TaxID=53246 RepID=UPI0006CA247D|nr:MULTISPECIES: pseudaminic acid cytidylyltransferase [Pseudoalteromonas]KPM78009.1 hypothetical protein AOG26_09185 [Pseudoalteromonas sp. UCD-33C]KPW02919.1 CMP-N,N'-diacetyllegionaminic acid synthase [Pseudoalteromonas sp. P1-8]KPZ74720.1 CMP-N,N'-diacetyllegionaminic acid synthase [Pseudoalteromonas sp. P1-26]MCG9735409.1 pseudaminic acid cytidylyltransferase [Pseudoalteromonas shioyasakiensis]